MKLDVRLFDQNRTYLRASDEKQELPRFLTHSGVDVRRQDVGRGKLAPFGPEHGAHARTVRDVHLANDVGQFESDLGDQLHVGLEDHARLALNELAREKGSHVAQGAIGRRFEERRLRGWVADRVLEVRLLLPVHGVQDAANTPASRS